MAIGQMFSEVPPEERTTVVLENLPRNYTRSMLIDVFKNGGFSCQYDFMFLPIDPWTGQNQGYVIMNLITPSAAAQFWDAYNGFSEWWRAVNWRQQVCKVRWSELQGLEANIEFYRNSPMMHPAVPDNCKPALFINGERWHFPLPTLPLFCPQVTFPFCSDGPTISTSAIPNADGPEDVKKQTTLLLEDLPEDCTREKLLAVLDCSGLFGHYDFVFLPIDFQTTNLARGYAIVNFTSSFAASRFLEAGKAFCNISLHNQYQGLDSVIERFRNSPVMHGFVPDECKPVVFKEGYRCAFPVPTKPIRPPRRRNLGVNTYHPNRTLPSKEKNEKNKSNSEPGLDA